MTPRAVLVPGLVGLLILRPALLWGQATEPPGALAGRSGPPPIKRARAVRIVGASPRLDGRLDDPAWQQAAFITDFIQKEPVEGATPSESTAVGILYDDDAIYIGARMYADSSDVVQRNVSRRDQGLIQSEHIWFSFDSYLDHRTAYSFGVTAAGVRMDWYHPTDNENDLDASFDPVWEARARVDSLGWTAELRIPFSQLRFRPQDVQVWGFNVDRWIPSKYEDIFWRPVPKNVTAWSSNMGELVGIEGIRPSRRLELLPYLASEATLTSNPDPANPFNADGRTAVVRAGGDLKAGIGPNLTVDATVNPDFGQVEADPAVVNLSAFETFFDEKRPFFIEGSQLLRGDGANYFYSRRIGAAPPGAAGGDYADAPGATTILSAAKLTGRTSNGLSVGALAAVTARETARTYDLASATYGRADIAPATGWGVMRLRQEFGPNRSTVGVMLTGVRRDLEAGSPLAELLPRQAVTGGADWNLRFAHGWYELRGYAGFSAVSGDTGAMARLQRAPQRYWQRPDQSYVHFDSTRTSLAGYTAGLSLGKISGPHWLWRAFVGAESPGLELNDIGRLFTGDGLTGGLDVRYREVRPGPRLRSWSVEMFAGGEWNYAWDRQSAEVQLSANAVLRNFMSLNLTGFATPRSQDERLTRGGPSMGTPAYSVVIGQVTSNFASKTQWRARLYEEWGEFGDRVYRVSGALTARPAPRWYVSATPNFLRSVTPRQYIRDTVTATAAAVYGRRWFFSAVDQTQWSMQLRFNYAFTPDLTLELYAEPFVASGHFFDHGELPAPRRTDLRIYGQAPGTTASTDSAGVVHVTADGESFTIANQDFHVASFRSSMVMRWEWRRGSTLYLVWQQNRGASRSVGERPGLGDLFEGLRENGDNFLAVKVSYWLSAR